MVLHVTPLPPMQDMMDSSPEDATSSDRNGVEIEIEIEREIEGWMKEWTCMNMIVRLCMRWLLYWSGIGACVVIGCA